MKIYTKKGDSGQTQLIGGRIVAKNEARIEAYGSVDELNSFLGLCLSSLAVTDHKKLGTLAKELSLIQNDLFCWGSQLACEEAELRKKLPAVPSERLSQLESQIDDMQGSLPELKEFILPGGFEPAARLQVARTVCRRSERQVVSLNEGADPLISDCLVYLNRLSDFLFVAARYCQHQLGGHDQKWEKP